MTVQISEQIFSQLEYLQMSFVAGLILCVIFDLFRSVRRVGALKKIQQKKQCEKRFLVPIPEDAQYLEKTSKLEWNVQLEDFLFCVAYIIVTFWVCYTYHDGQLSIYVFAGELLGVLLYYGIFHNWIRCVFTIVLWQICMIWKLVLCTIYIPFCKICGKIQNGLKYIVKSVKMVITNN